jgi:hypothetical protein
MHGQQNIKSQLVVHQAMAEQLDTLRDTLMVFRTSVHHKDMNSHSQLLHYTIFDIF